MLLPTESKEVIALSFFKYNRKICCRKPGEVELFGLILLIIGICTICAFLLPSKLWLIILGCLMVFCGFKLFNC